MIIGLTGAKEAGKDTVAAYLIKKHGYERRAFADPLKKSVAGLFDIPFSVIDRYKTMDNVHIDLVIYDEHSDDDDDNEIVASFNMRNFLQRYGTEAHRNVPEMGKDFWVDLTLPWQGYYGHGRNIAISDVRFNNEATRVRSLGGKVVEVVRPGTDKQDPHSSEAGIDPDLIDYTIFNNGTLDDLQTGVEVMLERLNESR